MADMTNGMARRSPLSRVALMMGLAGIALVILAAFGTGTGIFRVRIGILMLAAGFLTAIGAGLVAIIAMIRGRAANRNALIALAICVILGGYGVNQLSAATSVPPIHDVTTDLVDIPRFTALQERSDNFADITRQDWLAQHRKGYGDLKTLHLPLDTAAAMKRATALVQARGWAIAKVDTVGGTIEATDTSLFFRFKDDVVIRVRPDISPAGGVIVDMRSLSRVGQSDIGVNARRIRAFLADMQKG